ncbi:50S ribosomal protein L21, mitochondrial-like isoform X2 [Salvia hispanica]|uniref:50S ribosomal protein L21, mitochondrial-like isoform X2 n=1 Tax=Salvia hispanica TaxID=49212 RepID=UPI002009110B|nr:50S ribosomal protein L21, mitochondrial-like isoform X2 [Salvia hispanica]
MANRRCFQTLTRCLQSITTLTPISESLAPYTAPALNQTLAATPPSYIFANIFNAYQRAAVPARSFCSRHTDSDDDVEDDYESGEEGEDYSENEENSANLSAEEKEKEANEIGYTVLGPLQKSDRVFKLYEPVFAVVQIGSHQFKLVLNKVLMLGSQTQTIIGRPILPEAAVHAVVEEHALDAKVIIFKKKRRKNYRRTKGHRQELTKLRITDIQGIEKQENTMPLPPPPTKKKEKAEKKVAMEA